MATLAQVGNKMLALNPADSIYQALASGNQSGILNAGSQGTNSQINNAFYQQGVANPWYQANQAKLNRQGPMYQPGGMFYDPSIDGAGAPPGGGGINPAPAGGPPSALPPIQTSQPTGNVQSSAGQGPIGQPDWSQIDVSKFLDPNLSFTMGLGQQAINNSAAAKGGLLSGANLKGIADYTTGMANNAYANAQNAAFNDRNFMRGAYQNDRDYQTALDEWNKNFAQNQYQFNTGANQWQQQFGQNQYQFERGLDQNDRNFFYNAAQNDRNFNYNSLMDLARMGQYGTTGNAGLMDTLARLLSANSIAGGQAAAAGTLGGSNAINQIISQLLSQYGNNQFMNYALGGGQ